MSTELQEIAGEAYDWLELRKRDNGEEFICRKDDAPEWMERLCQAVHEDHLPDDHRYDFLHTALEALRDHDDPDNASAELEPDPYTHDLTTWLASQNWRTEYMDDVISEYCGKLDIAQILMIAQVNERREVLDLACCWLESFIEA